MPAPSVPSGPVDALGKAMANAPDQAAQGLTRAMEQVQQMWQEALQSMTQAMDGAGAMVVPQATDALAQLGVF